jgi:hypothetical protein
MHWLPESSWTSILQQENDKLKSLMSLAWDELTQASYGSGLLAFHVYCDLQNILEDQQAPVSHNLLSAFILSLAGAYSGVTISGYLAGLKAWHMLHSLVWQVKDREVELLLCAAEKMAPPSLKCPKRQPYTIPFIIVIRDQLDLCLPLHAAIFSCLTIAFYGMAHLGEVTVPTLKSFNPQTHIKLSDI